MGLKFFALLLCSVTHWSTVLGETKGYLFESGSYSYKIVPSSDDFRTWFEAEEICQEREGGHLASITSRTENTFLSEKISQISNSPDKPEELWLGGIDQQIVDEYQWIDGEKFVYSSAFWAPGEPNNEFHEDYEVCVALKSKDKRAQWVDDDCYTAKGYICKIKGLPKRLVGQTRFGYEFDHGNYIYKFILMQRDMLSWPEAEIYCREKEHGHLVSVRDLRESKTIEKHLRTLRYTLGFSKMWIGASDLNEEGNFQWTDGKPFSLQRWIPGEPSGRRRGMEEDCVAITAHPNWAQWVDENCLHHLPFICKTKVCMKRSDIGFAVDVSKSIRLNGFRRSKQFIKKVLENFEISRGGIHAGLISYSSRPRLEFGFDKYHSREEVEKAVDRTTYTRGGTRIDRALKLARIKLFALQPEGNSRMNIPRILILTTDGISPNRNMTATEALALKNEGVHVIVVAVGSRVYQKELKAIASRPKDVIRARSFASLVGTVQNLRNAICAD